MATIAPLTYGLSDPDDIRANGFMVAVHNDYRLDSEPMTFWLFTRSLGVGLSGGLAFKGEGKTDAEALDKVRRQVEMVDRNRTGAIEQYRRIYGLKPEPAVRLPTPFSPEHLDRVVDGREADIIAQTAAKAEWGKGLSDHPTISEAQADAARKPSERLAAIVDPRSREPEVRDPYPRHADGTLAVFDPVTGMALTPAEARRLRLRSEPEE